MFSACGDCQEFLALFIAKAFLSANRFDADDVVQLSGESFALNFISPGTNCSSRSRLHVKLIFLLKICSTRKRGVETVHSI